MQTGLSYRSKSASRSFNSLRERDLKLNLSPLILFKLQQRNINPERSVPNVYSRQQKIGTVQSSLTVEQPTGGTHKTLTKNRSAIDELKDLVSPRDEEPDFKADKNHKESFTMCQKDAFSAQKSIFLSNGQQPSRFQTHSTEYNQNQAQKTTQLLANEERKNMALLINLAKVEKQKSQVEKIFRIEKEKSVALEAKNEQFKKLFKQQIILNLELESFVGNLKIKHKKQKEELKYYLKLHKTNEDELRQSIESLKMQAKKQQKEFQKKLNQVEERFETASILGQDNILSLIKELKQKCKEVNHLKSCQKTTDSAIIGFEKKGTSTIPSHHNLDASVIENEGKLLRYPQREEEAEDVLELKEGFFEKKSIKSRPHCKTDRL